MTSILQPGRLAATGLVTLALGYVAARGISVSTPVLFASLAAFAYIVVTSGQLFLRAAHASDLPLAAAWSLGLAASALALLALVTLLPITAGVAFGLWAAMVLFLDVATAKSRKHEPAPDRADLVGLALCCAFVAIWCKEVAAVPAVLAVSGQFPAWIDYFLHAGVISQFGDARAIGRGAIWLADAPSFLYHYASYTIPAVFAWPLDQPGLPLATSIWAPIGILSLAGAAYALGVTLGGAAGGVAALAALFLLPDASSYGLRNGFFSFHWSLLAIPSTGYALGAALLAVVFLHRWAVTRSSIAFTVSAALVVATALFRVHVFLLLFPAWLAIVAIASQTVRRRRSLFIVLAGACAIGAVLALRFAPHLPPEVSWVFDEGRALERFLEFIHRRQEPTAYQGLYLRITTEFGESAGLVAGVLLVYPVCLGAFVLLYPLTLFLLRGRQQLAGIDGFPLALLAAYAGVMLLAPIPAHHEATDFAHRPFVLLYALVAAWTAASLVRWLSDQGRHGVRLWQTLVVGTGLALPFAWANAAEMARPKFYWSRPFVAHAVSRDLLAGAEILRTRARPGDTFAAWDLPTRQVSVDAPTELVALTGAPAYLARVWIHEALGGNNRIAALIRYRALGEVAQARDTASAMQKLRDLRVRWYVVTSPAQPAWDPQRSRAVWARGAVAIYDSGAEILPR